MNNESWVRRALWTAAAYVAAGRDTDDRVVQLFHAVHAMYWVGVVHERLVAVPEVFPEHLVTQLENAIYDLILREADDYYRQKKYGLPPH